MDNDSVSDGRRYRRKSDGDVYRVVVQARSLNGPVTLRAVEGPGEVETTNDRLAVDYEFFRVGEPERIPLAVPTGQQAFFDAHETAMNLAVRAAEKHAAHDYSEASELYRKAAAYEHAALGEVPDDKPLTRKVVAESVDALMSKSVASSTASVLGWTAGDEDTWHRRAEELLASNVQLERKLSRLGARLLTALRDRDAARADLSRAVEDARILALSRGAP